MDGWISTTGVDGEYEICMHGLKSPNKSLAFIERFPYGNNDPSHKNLFESVKIFERGELSKPERAPVDMVCQVRYFLFC